MDLRANRCKARALVLAVGPAHARSFAYVYGGMASHVYCSPRSALADAGFWLATKVAKPASSVARRGPSPRSFGRSLAKDKRKRKEFGPVTARQNARAASGQRRIHQLVQLEVNIQGVYRGMK
jgi:hypothetical protein